MKISSLYKILLSLFFLILGNLNLIAQEVSEDQNQLIQDVIENLESEGDFDYNTLFEQLGLWVKKPFDINEGDLSELVNLYLITDLQKRAIEQHLARHGHLLAIYELQSVDALDLPTIRRLSPFISTKIDLSDFNIGIGKMLWKGQNEVFMRWSRILEEQKGFTEATDPLASRYQGDPNRLYVRYRHSYENRLSYGITAEKDAGEQFFQGSNKQGFDFYSAHFFLKNYKNWLKAVAIGDYAISLGQGLVYNSGFAVGKSSFVTKIKRGGDVIRPFRSVNEADFLRGGAIHIAPTDQLDIALFASVRQRDGNITQDTFEDNQQLILLTRSFTSLLTSGLHRTQSEISNKNKVQNTAFGGSIKWHNKQASIALNVLHNKLSEPFQRREAPYNFYAFRGTSLTNISLDYSYILRNIHFFGETALSDNGVIASVNGLLIGLDRNLDASIMTRILPKNYHSLFPSPFAESGQGNNEYGIFFGLESRPSKEWTISMYYDLWKHPWLRFNIDAPSSGNEQLIKVKYYLKRKFELYAQVRRETKQRNFPANETPHDFLAWQTKSQLRLHMTNKVTKGLELRSRLEFSRYDLDGGLKEDGFMLYQDVILKPLGFPFSFTGRLAIFDTDGFNSRIYAYENDVIYSFSIPAYADRGTRYYLNVRYKGIRDLTLEARYARTDISNRSTLSSGLNEIAVPHRSEVKLQMIYRW